MEEPRTPSNETWWKLMADAPVTTPRAPRTPLTPRSFASLWSGPRAKREEFHKSGNRSHSRENNSTPRKSRRETSMNSETAERWSPEMQKIRHTEANYQAHSDKQSNVTNDKSNQIHQHPERRNAAESIDDCPPIDTPSHLIAVSHQDKKLSKSPGSGKSKKREAAVSDDAFEDNGSYADGGTTDKFLDILEDRVCSLDLTSPSLCEIEKRIEESWKEIERKTSQLFQCQTSAPKGGKNSTNKCQPASLQETNEAKNQSSKSPYNGRQQATKHDGVKPLVATYESPTSADSQEEEDSCLDDESTAQSDQDLVNRYEDEKRDESNCEEDDDDYDEEEKLTRKAIVDMDSYTDTFMESFRVRHGKDDNEREPPTPIYADSIDFDASTLSTTATMQTHPMLTIPPPPPLETTSGAPHSKEEPERKSTKTPTNTILTIFEPTNTSSLLVQNSRAKSQLRDRTHSGTYTDDDMPDLDPGFQRRCFSPVLGKKHGSSFGALNSAPTGSTVQSNRSRKSMESRNDDTENMYNAYIAYFQRGHRARGVVRLYEQPTPSTFPTLNQEIVVRIAYSTISHTDCAVRRGSYWGKDSQNPLNLPIVPGVAFSGYVTQLNRGAMRAGMRYGDRVISLVRVGANARHLTISRDKVVTVPDEVTSDKQLACIPEIYLGAFQILHLGQKNGARYKRTSLAGKSILILGGATILGKALIELCHAAGASTVYATGKKRHFTTIEAFRATPINRDPRHWYSLLQGRIDLVVGLDNDSFGHSEASTQHLEVLSSQGRAVLFGAPENSCDVTVGSRKKIFVYNVFDSWEKDLKQGKRDLSHLCKLLVDGSINPHVLETIPLNQVAEAQDTVEHRDFSAFLLCDPWEPTKREATSSRNNTSNMVLYSSDAEGSQGSKKTMSKSHSSNNKHDQDVFRNRRERVDELLSI